jgi:hypothetical protein
MSKKTLSIVVVIVLSSLNVGTTFAYVSLTSEVVSYTASFPIGYDGRIGQISFDLTMTLTCETNYSTISEGILPPSSTVHLNVTPSSATLTVDYHITCPLLPNLNGSNSTVLPTAALYGLLGDSLPIVIPIESYGTIKIVIHGKLLAENLTAIPQGSVSPTSLNWTTWTPHDTVVSAEVSSVTLKMDTAYDTYFTVTVSILGFDVVSVDSPSKEFSGTPAPAFTIPELLSKHIIPLLMIAFLLLTTVNRRRQANS